MVDQLQALADSTELTVKVYLVQYTHTRTLGCQLTGSVSKFLQTSQCYGLMCCKVDTDLLKT